MSAENICIKPLETRELIEEACALLYKTHIEESNWKFEPDNPSKIRVEIRHNKKILVDRFTDKAVWFGAFEEEKMVGCVRLLFVDENNQFEMERYKESEVIQQYLPKDKKHCVEINRAAVTSTHSGLGIMKQLFYIAFQYCKENQYSVFGASRHGYIIALFKKIRFPLKIEYAFKYERKDPLAVNFYFADYEKSEVENMLLNLNAQHNAKILDALEIVAPILPALVYWHDTKNVVLGVNGLCLEGMGLAKASDVIGKTPYDFYPREVAAHIVRHNESVIKTGEILSQDEKIEDISTGKTKIFSSTKAPLYDEEGRVIGVVGCSIEVTTEREAEYLRIENEKQKILLREEEKFRKLAHKVAHDIRSPLTTLLMIVRDCNQIPESNRIALREAATHIGDIANHLLHQYQKQEINVKDIEDSQDILVYTALIELLTAKKYQYKSTPTKFDYQFKINTVFACIHISASAFKRMLSNLMNNAVDACEGKPGEVSLQLEADHEWVNISIKDTGSGMPKELVRRIMNKTAFTSGKASGHGIGLTQVWKTLEDYQGEMRIDSRLGWGTAMLLRFPRTQLPHWMIEEILLNADDTVVILDDDASIHSAWDIRFEPILSQYPEMQLKHFEEGEKALEFIDALSVEEKNRIFLFSDYELLEQELNGLQIIDKSQGSRSILVTSHYADRLLQENARKMGIKILPKQLASEIHIKIIETK